MKLYKKILLINVSILFLVGCDATTKSIAKNELNGKVAQSYLNGNIQFTYVENEGGMLNLGKNLPDKIRFIIFTIFVGLTLAFLYAYTVTKKGLNKWHNTALVLILGGGIGNLLTRIINDGKVIDFIILELIDYHTGIFNIADVYITSGVIILIISKLLDRKKSLIISV